MALMDQLDAVVIAVSYRLAPEFPFPTAVEDAADAISHVSLHSSDFSIDPDGIYLSGSSDGGTLVFTALNLINSPSTCGYTLPGQPHRLRGLCPSTHPSTGRSHVGRNAILSYLLISYLSQLRTRWWIRDAGVKSQRLRS